MKLNEDAKIFSYVVDHDLGREPNPYGGICTLCRCKYGVKREKTSDKNGRKNIVELAKEGDWVIGTGGVDKKKSAGHGKLLYAMRVDEKPSRDEFYNGTQFSGKNPERPLNKFQKNEQFALVSRHFYYFGENAIDIPDKFRHFEKPGPGFRHVKREEFALFLEEIGRKWKMGKHGEPCCPKPVDDRKGCKKCKSCC